MMGATGSLLLEGSADRRSNITTRASSGSPDIYSNPIAGRKPGCQGIIHGEG